MAILFMEGFDTYRIGSTVAEFKSIFGQTEGRSISGDGAVFPTRVDARTSGGAMACNAATTRIEYFSINMGTPVIEGGVGVAVRAETLPLSAAATPRVLWFKDAGGVARMSLHISAVGGIEVYRDPTISSAGTAIAVSASNLITAGVYNHIEVKWLLAGSDSRISVRLNGVTVIDNVLVTLNATSFLTVGSHSRTGNTGSGSNIRLDDMYAWDTTGDVNNDFIGDCAVTTLLVDSVGSNNDFTVTGAATGHQALNDLTETTQGHDSDGSFISLITAPSSGSFGFETLGGTGAVKAVQSCVFDAKSDTGDSSITVGILDPNGENNSQAIPQTVTYMGHYRVFEKQANGTNWTVAAVDSSELLVKRVL